MRSACEEACGLQLCGAAEDWGVGSDGDREAEEGEDDVAFAWCCAQGWYGDSEGWVTSCMYCSMRCLAVWGWLVSRRSNTLVGRTGRGAHGSGKTPTAGRNE